MKTFLISLIVLVGTLGLGTTVLHACGAKFLVGGKSARYQRLMARITPARILIYWLEDETTKAEDRWNPDATKALETAGHRVEVAFDSDTFLKAVEGDSFDVVMMPLSNARQLAAEVRSLSPHCALLPVAYFPTRREYSEAKKEFENVLKYPTTLNQLLTAVEKSRNAAPKT